jgi:S-adenosylmethionine:tRNA ribosyltransferase-isomerase
VARQYRAGDFDYAYPPEAVAQDPLADRAASRLLVLDRGTGHVTHSQFRDFPALLKRGDVLVLNTSRVIPARLRGRRDNGRPAEVLLVHAEPDGTWLAMVHPGGKLKTGRRVSFGDEATLEIVDVVGGGLRRVRIAGPLSIDDLMERFGSVPLPPYITRQPRPEDRIRYQTVYATTDGSVAAPTAGLHFTTELLDAVAARGAIAVDVLLHVGPGTFKPVDVDDPADHAMHAEWYAVPDTTARCIAEAKARGSLVWAVGTTVARALEAAATEHGIRVTSGWTDLFIFPPYRFKVVDRLLTNFHRPRSTLIMLVAAFAGYESTMAAYRAAVADRYRLFSYGDAMAVV